MVQQAALVRAVKGNDSASSPDTVLPLAASTVGLIRRIAGRPSGDR